MKIKIEELLEQICVALSDEFNADVLQEGENIVIDFNGKQKFEIKVVEV